MFDLNSLDLNSLAVYSLGAIFGVLVGFVLTSITEWRHNRRKVGYLRRWVYNDIHTIYFNLKALQNILTETLKDKQFAGLLEDEKTVDALLDYYDKLRRNALNDHWYKTARADPHLFAQLSNNELRVIDAIYLLLSKEAATSQAAEFHSLKRLQAKEPKERLNIEKNSIEHVIYVFEGIVRGGLKKDEFMKLTISEEDRQLVNAMFGNGAERKK